MSARLGVFCPWLGVAGLPAGDIAASFGVAAPTLSSSRGPRVHSHRRLLFLSDGVFVANVCSLLSPGRSRTAAARIWRRLYLLEAFFGHPCILLSSSDVGRSSASSSSFDAASVPDSDSDSSEEDRSE